MARGPRPDPDQAAKGYPGRRKAKAASAADAAQALAKLLAPRAASADLPAMLADPKYAPAAVLWRSLAPELRRTHRLPVEAEQFFVMVCVYTQEWVASTEDLHEKGFAQYVKTVAGGEMERRRPKVFDRQQAFSNLMELSAKFGLTPHDMYQLFKGQALVAMANPGLFGDDRKGGELPLQASAAVEGEDDAPPVPGAPPSRIGGMGAMRSAPPPGDKPN